MDGALTELIERCRRDHAAWMNGDSSAYELPEDGTIMGAVGSYSRGGASTAERQAAVARQWASGRGEIEYVNGAVVGDTAWVAFIERATVVFVGDPRERRWDLRVTEIFRRRGSQWERVHRHADPLVDRRAVRDVAALLET